MGRPPNHAASRERSIDSASVPDSRRAIWRSSGKRFTAATTRMIPVIATTTRISTRVKPLIPVADVRRIAFSAARAVGTEAEHVDLAMLAGRQVLVVGAPRILGQVVEVGLPVAGHRIRRGFLHERAEALDR